MITLTRVHLTILLTNFDANSEDTSASFGTLSMNQHNIRGIIAATESTVAIHGSTFHNNVYTFRSRPITNSRGILTITTTSFIENSEVLTGSGSKIFMYQCMFKYNRLHGFSIGTTNDPDIEHDGIIVADTSEVTMIMCSFFANEATETGGIVVMNKSIFESRHSLEVSHNQAMEGTFVVIESTSTLLGNINFANNNGSLSMFRTTVDFIGPGDVVFQNNTSSSNDNDTVRGGAITAYYYSVLNFTLSTNVTLINKNALNGAGICAVGSVILIGSHVKVTDNRARNFGGGVFLFKSHMVVYFNVSITNNEAKFGGGICELNSYLGVISVVTSTFHDLSITNNRAISGGGLYISDAKIYLNHLGRRTHNINVVLTSNSAEYGGAIFVRDETNPFVCQADAENDFSSVIECFFQVVDIDNETGSLGLHFHYNTATTAGPVRYGGLLDRCAVIDLVSSTFFESDFDRVLTNTKGIDFFTHVSHLTNVDLIASESVKVCFCSEGKPNCSMESVKISTLKGSIFTVSVCAFDHVGHLMNATILSELQSITGGLGEGQQSQAIDDQCTNLSFSVSSIANNETIAIYADGP